MHIPGWLRVLVVLVALGLQPTTVSAAPQVGWWWNPNESGRGFFIESQNGIIYLAGYFYESDGRATWLVAGGPNADSNTYRGRLLAYGNGQTLFGSYQPPAPGTDVGEVTLSFTDDAHGTFTWPGGTIPIERHRFGGDPISLSPDPGWWWNEAESGRGYSVEVQGDTLFIVGFMYDDAGNPLWYFSAGKMASETEYQGSLLQFSNGQTLTGTYHPPGPPAAIGLLDVEFTAIDEATFTFSEPPASSEAQAHPKAGRSKIIDVKREFPAKPTYNPAARYAGTFVWKSDYVHNLMYAGHTVKETIKIVATGNLTWQTDPELPDLPDSTFRGPSYTYALVESPGSPVTFTYTQTQVGGGATCTGSFTETLGNNGSKLRVNRYAQYVGTIKFVDLVSVLTLTCKYDDGSSDDTRVVPSYLHVEMNFKGKAVKGGLDGKLKPLHPVPEITVTGNWTFAAITP